MKNTLLSSHILCAIRTIAPGFRKFLAWLAQTRQEYLARQKMVDDLYK